MKRLLSMLLFAPALLAQASTGLKLGDACPVFSLPGIDGKQHGPESGTALLVVFLIVLGVVLIVLAPPDSWLRTGWLAELVWSISLWVSANACADRLDCWKGRVGVLLTHITSVALSCWAQLCRGCA